MGWQLRKQGRSGSVGRNGVGGRHGGLIFGSR